MVGSPSLELAQQGFRNSGLLRIPEAAEMLGVKPATIRSWVLRREIPYVKLTARAVRIRRSDVQAFIDKNLVPARSR